MIIEHEVNGRMMRFNATGLVSIATSGGKFLKLVDLDDEYPTGIGPIKAQSILAKANLPYIEIPAKDEKKKYALTAKQKDALDFIRVYLAEQGGISPSFDEIKNYLGLSSKSGVHRLIIALEERGHIERMGYRKRSIVLKG